MVDNSTPGTLTVTASGTTALSGGAADIVDVLANVPMSAESQYDASALLQLINVLV